MQSNRFPVIGVGASAGGLESLERFFRAVPIDSGYAYVVIQHLSPNFKSMMPQLLARRTALPMLHAEDGVLVEPDHVYLLPPGKTVVLADQRLVLRDKEENGLTLAIDVFLESLAREAAGKCAALILSGTGSDGSNGAEHIRRAGGVVMAESQSTARFYGMPRSVIDRGLVDAILPPEEMPAALERLFRGERLVEPGDLLEPLQPVLHAIRIHEGLDFSSYKPATLRRRMARRAQLLETTEEELIHTALVHTERRRELVRDFLIHVTSFFRDAAAFDQLTPHIARQLTEVEPHDTYRVWVPACSTGQEAYSLAILIEELRSDMENPPDFKVFATDVSADVLRTASMGRYKAEALESLSRRRIERFFDRSRGAFVVKPALRDRVVFSPHNLLLDPPFTNLHLVSCRNLLIYLQVPAQERALSYIHFGLRRDGLLFVGASETTSAIDGAFADIPDGPHLFRRLARAERLIPKLVPPHRDRIHARVSAAETPRYGALYSALCHRLLPPSILLDEDHRVIETFGGAERYLSVKARRFDATFLTLIDADVKGSLGRALRVLDREPTPMIVRGVELTHGDGTDTVDLQLTGIEDEHGGRFVLVTLVSESTSDEDRPRSREFFVEGRDEGQLEGLEEELSRTRRHLQETVEQLEASNQELQATNEELVASNEELQSTNEELSSVNEELYTVNTEYQRTIDELRNANADIDLLLRSTEIATLFLDGELRIRRFTPDIGPVIDLEEQDVGRRISSFRHRLDWEDFYGVIEEVARTGEPVEREVPDEGGRRLLVRISCFDDRREQPGVVVTMTDVSHLARARAQVRARERELRELFDALPILLSHVDQGEAYTYVNGAYLRLFDRPSSEFVGKRVRDVVAPEVYEIAQPYLQRAHAGEALSYELTMDTPRGRKRVHVTYVPRAAEDGAPGGFYAVLIDITSAHELQAELEAAMRRAQEASRAKTQFLANMSHEIRTPLTAVLGYAEILEDCVPLGRGREYVSTIRRNGQHLLAIINDVLDLSRIEVDQVQLAKRPFRLQELLDGVIELFHERADRAGIELRLELPSQLPDRVVSDPQRVRQILFNLVSNAIKFTDKGAVTLRLAPIDRDAPRLDITVADTGIGFTPEEAELLFEPFQQADDSHARTHGGTGLGLTISRRLVQALQGSLDASSVPGSGSEFRVQLPVDLTRDARWAEPTRASNLPGPSRVAGAPMSARILVVDDADDLRTLVATTLRERGAEVVERACGTAALELLETDQAWDLIIMDMQMPVLDGLETTRRLRLMGVDAPVLALTARALDRDRAECLEAGCDEHLAKPVDASMLASTTRRLLRQTSPSPRVLIVDDDDDMLELLRLSLEQKQMRVAIASSITSAIARVASEPHDIVISDLTVAHWGDGLELGAQLRALSPRMPLIALSGAADMKEQALRNGFDRFLLKPPSKDDLVATIHTLLHRPAASDASG